MIAAGEPAVVVLLGERWRGAGVALVAMSGLSIGSAIGVVVQDAIKAHGRTRLINWFTLAELFLGVGFLLVLIRPFGFAGASLYISLTSLAATAIILGLAQLVVTVPLRRVLTVLATPMPGLLVATVATWWLEHDLLRSDSRGPMLAVALLAVDALVFCLVYLAVLTIFARPTVVTIVRIVPVLIARFRREALADTTSPRMGHISSDTSAPRPAAERWPRPPGPAGGPGLGGRMIEVPDPNTAAVIASLNPRPKKTALNRTAHTATITPEDGGFLVTCPDGCNLGTSAHQPDQRAAEGRAELHRLATAPLIPDTTTTR